MASGHSWPGDAQPFQREWAGRTEEARAKAKTYPSVFGMVMELGEDPATEINWAGESAGLVRAVQPAAAVVAATAAEAERLLRLAINVVDLE